MKLKHSLFILILLIAQPAFALSDRYKPNPWTGKLDNIGDGTAGAVVALTGELLCASVADGTITWSVCDIPVPPAESKILAESNDILTTEDSKDLLI